MARNYGSLNDWEVFYTPDGRAFKKTSKPGRACLLADEALLYSFADGDVALSMEEYARLQSGVPLAEIISPPKPKPPAPAPAPEPSAPAPVPESGSGGVEFDADAATPPAPDSAPAPAPEPIPEPSKSHKKK